MTRPTAPSEPLSNIDLESSILGLRMTLSDSEEFEARKRFIAELSTATLVVPTAAGVPLAPDGSMANGSDITFVVLETAEGSSGVPGFTTLAGLKQALPNVSSGLYLSGSQLASILATSPHKLFVEGPDMHVEVDSPQLQSMAEAAQKAAADQEAAANHNASLESALGDILVNDTLITREAVINAFMSGFCRIPVAGPSDEGATCVVMRTESPAGAALRGTTPGGTESADAVQETPLITEDNTLLCFTSEDAMRRWRNVSRNAVSLPGVVIFDMVRRTGIPNVALNRGSATTRTLRIDQDRLLVD